MILYRPVGTAELELIKQSNYRCFPPRLPEQPIFYPVLNREYAREIAEKWNTKTSDRRGYVTEFEVDDEYCKQFEVHTVGKSRHQELWIPAGELDNFNRHIVGRIKITDEFSDNKIMTVSTRHGDIVCHSKNEVKKLIESSSDDDIWISIDTEYPCLAILINGQYACIHYFEDENGTAFQSHGDLKKQITFIAGGTEWTAPPEAVVTLEKAVKCMEEFCDTLKRPDCIEWQEL